VGKKRIDFWGTERPEMDGETKPSGKRARVTFAEGEASPARKRAPGTQDGGAGAGSGSKRAGAGAYDEFDDDDQADGGMRYADVEEDANDSGG
jgi:hypothetical protein